MSEQLKESLSAVMDGEADEFEIRRVLNEAADDSELRGVWERYHLARSAMRGEGSMLGAGKLGRGFWAKIDAGEVSERDEAAQVVARTEPGRRESRVTWNQRVAGVMVAAGVAAAVVVWFGSTDDQGVMNAKDQIAQVELRETSTAPVALIADDAQPADVNPTESDRRRAQAYMLHHAHQVALTNQARAVPFVKVAAFESR